TPRRPPPRPRGHGPHLPAPRRRHHRPDQDPHGGEPMTWLTLRQFRAQALIAAAAIATAAIYFAFLGNTIRDAYDRNLVDCATACNEGAARQLIADRFGVTLMLLGAFLIAVPALLGAFWAAPMITRELETGTHRLVWN